MSRKNAVEMLLALRKAASFGENQMSAELAKQYATALEAALRKRAARGITISGGLPIACSLCGRSAYEHPGGGQFVPCGPLAQDEEERDG